MPHVQQSVSPRQTGLHQRVREVKSRPARSYLDRLAHNRESRDKIHAIQICCGMFVAASEMIASTYNNVRERIINLRPFYERYRKDLQRILRKSYYVRRMLKRLFGKPGSSAFAYRVAEAS